MAVKKAGAPIQGDTGAQGGETMKPVFQKAKKAGAVEVEVEAPEKGEDEEEAAGNDMTSKAKKSMDLSEDDLQKSLDKLSTIATEGSPVSRKEALLHKAQAEELTKSETSELFQLLGGAVEAPAATLAKSVEQNFETNEVLQKAVDVSDYLDENQKALVKSLATLSDHLEAGDKRQHEFNLVLAKAVSGVGRLVKGMSERLGVIESQPARGPKSKGIQPGQVLQKGFGGQPAASDQLNHQQILDGLDALMQKSMTDGKDGLADNGENILMATAKFEQTRTISPGMISEIQRFRQGRGSQQN